MKKKREEEDQQQNEGKQEGKKPKGKVNEAIQLAKKIKEEMKDFYKNQYSSTINLQNSIKNRGFSYLNSNCEEGETIVEVVEAQQIVDIYLQNLKDLLPQKIYNHCCKFLKKWKSIRVNKFTKKEILFSEKGSSSATFVGVYQKRTKSELYLCYKVCKNAFKLAPDIYVVQEVQSKSVGWGMFSKDSKVDRLEQVTRGFTMQDLNVLLQISSVSVLDLGMIHELKDQ